jgi:hypothetical protein
MWVNNTSVDSLVLLFTPSCLIRVTLGRWTFTVADMSWRDDAQRESGDARRRMCIHCEGTIYGVNNRGTTALIRPHQPIYT